MRFKKVLLTAGLIVWSVAFTVPACSSVGTRQSQPPRNQPSSTPSPAGVGGAPDRQRYQLDGSDGDWISVLLPHKPTDFGVANLKRPTGAPLPARVYMFGAEAKTYFVLFIDLPQAAASMSGDERGELFYGCWKGLAAKTSEALEEKFGSPFQISSSEQKFGEMQGGERRMQDFKVGTQNGRAQVMFVGQRAYLLAVIWDNRPESENDALRFLESFQVKGGRR
ncbi:MAG: hypothetical protein QOJ76_3509 [Acidobacteriota bacterium]|jgi:hypothetical protein|nr:hypothetical protein [Acidobacteriota bacterium]